MNFKLKLFIAVLFCAASSLALARVFRAPLMARYTYSREVLDREGKLLRLTLSGDEKYRIYTPLSEINPVFVEAVLLKEDQHFRQHPGVNPYSILKAAVHTYGGSGRRIGGSTITMQLARMTSTTPSRTPSGKITQMLRALWLEALYSKDEILEAYLNLLPYGSNIEGVGAASRIYFSKDAAKLALTEALTLAVVPQNPKARLLREGELGESAPGSMVSARRKLFAAWVERHPEDRDADLGLKIGLETKKIAALPFKAPHFAELALARSLSPDFRKNSRVLTTLDSSVQDLTERKLKDYVLSKSSIGVKNAAALVLNHETMEVVAMVGSADYFDDSIEGQVNGTIAKRSPGSTMKPFAYALALDQGLIHPLTLLKDTPMSFGSFDPENFDHHFSGPVSATDALVRSRNVPAVYLASELKQPTLYDFMKASGVTSMKEASFYGLSLPLGGAEVSMEELVRLYALLANRGELRQLKYFSTDQKKRGEEKNPQLLSAEASFLVLDMLRQNMRSTQIELSMRDSVPVAWKTGTSHGYRDAWTVGVMGPYVIAVWLGNFDNESNPAFVGRDLASPLFFNIVDGLKNQARNDHIWLSPIGLNLKKVTACALSGQLPGKHCHHQVTTWFIPGKSPIATCTIHREVLISKRSGLRACDDAPSAENRHEVFEFWPSDLLQVFRLAGVPRKAPPGFDPSCNVEHTQNSGLAPLIKSPKKDVVYSLRVTSGREQESEEMIPLEAVADGDAHHLHWFVGSKYLGEVDPFHPLLWKPTPGKHVVRVVDDLGRSNTQELIVKVTK